MAELDPKTATLRQVAEAYAAKSKRKGFVGPTLQYFKDIADEPGSAMRLFEKDAEGNTLLSKTFKGSEDTSTVKTAMQNLRQVGLTLKESVGPDTPEYKLLPDKAPNTDLNNRIFGRPEPAKAVSEIAINPDKKKMSELFAGVSKYLDDPKTRPIAQAIIFNLNTGLRPNAVGGLQVSSYKPDTGAIYIEAETKGAKGRAVNIPLNPVADSILQENLAAGNKEFFFTKPNGKSVTSEDMTDLLKEIKVEDITFDQATVKYFDTLAPENFKGKKGSALLRNVHSTIGHSIGISQERLAYLQGRSLKAAAKGSTGELATYQQAFPGAVGEVDRANANMFASFWGDAAKEAGFDIGERIPMPTERITTATAGYEGYFDLPVKEEVPAPVSKPTSASPEPKNFDDLSEGTKAWFRDTGVDFNDLIKNFGKKGAKVLAGAIGVETARQIITEPAAFAKDIALEAGARAVGMGMAPAAAVPMILSPTQTAGPELDEMPQPQQDFIPAREVEEETPTEQMARIATEDAGFVQRNREPEAAPVANQGFIQP